MTQEIVTEGAQGAAEPADSAASDFDWGFNADAGDPTPVDGESVEVEGVDAGGESESEGQGQPSDGDAGLEAEGASPEAGTPQPDQSTPTPPDAAGQQPGAANAKVKAFGREFDSIQHLEQTVGSWEGRINQVREHNRTLQDDVQRFESYANDVYQKNQQLLAELESLKGGGKSGEPGADSGDATGGLDMAGIQKAMQIAQSAGYNPLEVGIRMVAEQLQNNFDQKLEQSLQTVREPIEQSQAREQAVQASENLFVQASLLKNDSGDLLFPELNEVDGQFDATFAKEMHSNWLDIAREDVNFAFTQRGLDYAYRLAKEALQPAASVSQTPAAPASPAPTRQPARDPKTGQFVGGNRPPAEPPHSSEPSPGTRGSEPQDIFDRMMDNGRVVIDGFDMGFGR